MDQAQIDRARLQALQEMRQPGSSVNQHLDEIQKQTDRTIQRKLLWHLLAIMFSSGIDLGAQLNTPPT